MVARGLDAPGLDRLGLRRTFGDHDRTLYRLGADNSSRPRVADRVIFLGLPLALAAASVVFDWRLSSVSPILNGVAILSGGLFGLLVLILSVQTIGHGSGGVRPAVLQLIRETRANVSYATVVALLFAASLMLVDAFSAGTAGKPLAAWLSGAVLAVLAHLVLTLLMVVNRIRLVFDELG